MFFISDIVTDMTAHLTTRLWENLKLLQQIQLLPQGKQVTAIVGLGPEDQLDTNELRIAAAALAEQENNDQRPAASTTKNSSSIIVVSRGTNEGDPPLWTIVNNASSMNSTVNVFTGTRITHGHPLLLG